jgi:quinol monooxygenase YgiN
MISQVVRIKVKPGCEGEFAARVAALSRVVEANEPGTMVYRIFRTEDPLRFVVLEIYADEAALAAHRKAEHMAAALPHIGPLVDGALEVEKFDEIVP